MHALSACTCMCLGAEPHLLQVAGLQGGTVAMATALEFLYTDIPPDECCLCRRLSRKDDAACMQA